MYQYSTLYIFMRNDHFRSFFPVLCFLWNMNRVSINSVDFILFGNTNRKEADILQMPRKQ